MTLIRQIPWTEQPPEGSSPAIASGLRVLHNPAAGPINLVDARAITYTLGSATPSPAGVAREAPTASYSTTLSSAHSVPAGSDFTVVMVITSLTTATQNAGLFRSATGTDTFALIKTGTGGNYPWVRLAGVNILNAASGAAIPTGRPVTVVVSVRSGSRVDVAWDGAVRQSATHSTATPAFTFSVIGSQGGEYVGPFALFAFSHQALDAADVSSNPWQLFAPRVQRIFAPAAGGTSVTVDGQTITGTATIIAGAVTTTASATANGQTLVAAATLIGGGASAGGTVTVDGQTITAAGSLIAGAVTTTQSITVTGITANAAATLVGGGASTPIPGVGRNRRSALSLGLGIHL